MRPVVVGEDAVRRAIEIVELTIVRSPPEARADQQHQYHRQRNEQEQDVHRSTYVIAALGA